MQFLYGDVPNMSFCISTISTLANAYRDYRGGYTPVRDILKSNCGQVSVDYTNGQRYSFAQDRNIQTKMQLFRTFSDTFIEFQILLSIHMKHTSLTTVDCLSAQVRCCNKVSYIILL